LAFPSRSINDVVALVSQSKLVISPDTSVVHIASAFNVPCIALFHSLWWNVHKFAPLSTQKWIVQSVSPSDLIRDVPVGNVIQCLREWELINQISPL
jgi:heptosyltransferase III